MKPMHVAGAACLVLPPALNAVVHLINPLTASGDAGLIRQAVAHPALTGLVQAQYILLLFAPAAVLLAAITQSSGGFSRGGGVALGAAGLAAWSGPLTTTVLYLAAHSAHPQSWLQPLHAFDHSGVLNAFTAVFILGQLIGFVLLGVAGLRSRAVAPWAAWTVIAAAVLNVVGHSVPGRYVDAGAWALLAVGLGGYAFTRRDEHASTIGEPTREYVPAR